MLKQIALLFLLCMTPTTLSMPFAALADPAPAAAAADDAASGATVHVDSGESSAVAVSEPAALPEVDPADAADLLSNIFSAAKQGQWAWFAGLLLMLLTLLFNKIFKSKIPKAAVPWVAVGLGVSSSIAMGFATGLHWLEAIGSGITMGLAAVGGWEALGKHLKKKPAADPTVTVSGETPAGKPPAPPAA